MRFNIAALGILVVLAMAILSGCGSTALAAQNAPKDPPDQQVISNYVAALNAGIQSGDFSALLAIYAPDAVLTASTPKGVTTVSTGTAELGTFFQNYRTAHPGLVFAVDSVRILSPHVVLTYKHAAVPTWLAPGRCMHIYTIKAGKVQSLDWATFYGGQPA